MSTATEAFQSAPTEGQPVTTSSAEPSTSNAMTETESAGSPSTSSPPVRPPKAAKRPSTASLATPAGTLGLEAVEGAPVALGPPASVDNGGLGRDEQQVEPSTTTNVAQPVVASREPREDEKTSTTVSTTAGSSETTDSKAVPTVTASKPSTTTPAAATSPRSAPSTSTAKPTPTSKATKKKRKGPFAFLFACVPCISDPGHDDSHDPASRTQNRPATNTASTSTASPVVKKEKENISNEKVAPTEPVASTKKNSLDEKTPVVVPSPSTSSPVEPATAITPSATEPLAAASPSTPVAAPPPSSSPTPQGVTLPREETEGVTSGAVVPPGQATLLNAPPTVAPKSRRRKSGKHPHSGGGTDGIITSVPEPGARAGGILMAGSSGESETSEDASGDEDDEEEYPEEEEEEDEEQSLIARGGVGIPIGEDGLPHPLLDELTPDLKGRKCLVLDLDETLVHSSFKMVHQADYVVPVEIENQFHNVYVIKRPGVDGFLKAMGEIYEVVVFTASLSKYADPVLDQLDIHRVVKHRLFRESCYNNKGNYVKDLSQLGRPIDECIIIDNSPASYVFHVNNAVPISSWFNDPHDTELTDLVPFLTDLSTVDDVRSVLDAGLYQHLAQPQLENGTDDVFNQI
ncbi:hypothetical protein JCM16303_006286 [Sporobolomyces ruberrimus]